MTETEYGLRRRATEIAAERKREECERKQEGVKAVAVLTLLAVDAKVRETVENGVVVRRDVSIRGRIKRIYQRVVEYFE